MDFSQMNLILGGESRKPKKTNKTVKRTYKSCPDDVCENGDTITETQTDTSISVFTECDEASYNYS